MFKRPLQCKAAGAARPQGAARRGLAVAAAFGLLLAAPVVTRGATDLSPVPLPTYTVGSSVDVKPNILMVLDDSGSMDWDFMPDWAVLTYNNGTNYSVNYRTPPDYLRRNSAFNGVAYNPAVTYAPPVTFDASGKNTTKYPNITDWTAVPNDGYGIQSTSTSNLVDRNNYYYTIEPGEYCNSPAMTNCQTTQSGNYQYPAPLRWCDSAALTNCRALWDNSTFKYPRIAAPRVATVTVVSSGSRSISGLTVDGLQIMKGSSITDNDDDLADSVRDQINACATAKAGNCTTVGYTASSSGRVVTIYAPGKTTATPVVTGGTGASSITGFVNAKIPLSPEYLSGSSQSSAPVPGYNLRTVITSTVTSYPKAGTRTDCAGSSCTYTEEMTNYANWWAYYRTRMQMMKTATSRAFSSLDSAADIAANRTRYRVGYLTLNNNTGSDFVNITDFDNAQKVTWFSRMLKAKPNSGTPLRQALSRAGQLYAGVLNGKSLNGVTVNDPSQFSCQKNYTILSTDGYWNGADGQLLDGSSMRDVNVDGLLPRPYNDGGRSVQQTRTSQLQKRSYTLQKRTSSNRGRSWTGWSGTSSCTEDFSGSGQTDCRFLNDTGYLNATSCTAVGPTSNGTTTECRYNNWTSWSTVGSCTAAPRSAGPTYNVGVARECQGTTTGGVNGSLADVAAYYYNTDLRDSSATGTSATGTCTGPVISPATTPTDLCANNVLPFGRDNNPKQHMTTHTLGLGAQGRMVFSAYQNDASGQRVPSADYWTQPSGDFYSVANGSIANPTQGICSWMSANATCTWPTPDDDRIENIDDLWHAAVNGHGTYFSAQDPSTLASALTSVLSQIVNTPRPGTAAAAASSNPNITSSDNFVFSSSYRSVEWYGELIMQQFREDGTLSEQKWSAMRLLDCATTPWTAGHTYKAGDTFSSGGSCYLVQSDFTTGGAFDGSSGGEEGQNTLKLSGTPLTRTIYTAGSTSALVPFTWTDMSAAQKAYFSAPYINFVSASQGLSQFCTVGANCLGTAAQTSAAGQALVNFLRGDRSNEGVYFRQRQHVLGDIVSSEARYVKEPLQKYLDAGYPEFKTLKTGRASTVYVGANDGMLHAFDATTGQERWAFIPSAILPEMYKLADTDYSNKHRYFVDGTPEVGDFCPKDPPATCTGAEWKTILVGGLNQGGKSFYALDITDPASPSLLWEFTNANLGYTYSNPRITKLQNGTWVVIVASGYNGTDGVGRLYVIKAADGTLVRSISTGVGSAANPSGLAKLAARSPLAPANNTVTEVYGGDLLGNLWRFDVNDAIGASGYDAQLVINLQDASGNPQPITAKPTVASINEKPLVMVGTGRYLGLTDLDDTTTFTMYAVKDKLDATTLTTPRTTGSNFVKQTMIDTQCPDDAPATICSPGQTVRTVSAQPVDWSVRNGWYVDFLLGGERSVTDATLALGTLVFTTVKPQASTVTTIIGCNGTDPGVNATSYLYYLNYLTGGAVDGTKNVVGEELCTCIATRPSVVRAQSGAVEGIIRTSGGAVAGGGETEGGEGESTDMGYTSRQDLPYAGTGGPTRRISWRELISD
jgi:type IV pilus assembly protein PilY1